MIGGYFLCALTANYAYCFSAPAILQASTGWSVTNVGFLMACFGLAGAAAMLLNGAHSDRTGERAFHCIIPCVVMAAGYTTASLARALAGGDVAGSQLHGVHGDAGAGTRGPHAVPRRARRRCGHRGDEYHHHVQRIRRPLLDGRDEGCNRQLRLACVGLDVPSLGRRQSMFVFSAQPGAAARPYESPGRQTSPAETA